MDLSQTAAATNGYQRRQSSPLSASGSHKGSPQASPLPGGAVGLVGSPAGGGGRPNLRVVIPNARGEVVSESVAPGEDGDGGGGDVVSDGATEEAPGDGGTTVRARRGRSGPPRSDRKDVTPTRPPPKHPRPSPHSSRVCVCV